MTDARVVVADDHPVFARALGALVDATHGLTLAAAPVRPREAMELIIATRPALAVVAAGRECDLEAVRTASLTTRIMLLASSWSASNLYNALGAGVCGAMPKSATAPDLQAAMLAVVDGGVVVHPSLSALLVHEIRDRRACELQLLDTRERAILDGFAAGEPPEELAPALNLTQPALKAASRVIYRKLGAPNRAAAVRLALRRGFIS